MKTKYLKVILVMETILCLVGAVWSYQSSGNAFFFITFPFKPLAFLLRKLSLAGFVGNIFAVIFYTAICISPICYVVYKKVKKKFNKEDLLLCLLSILLFIGFYLMIYSSYVNQYLAPTNMREHTIVNGLIDMISFTLYTIVFGYLIIRVLNKYSEWKTERIYDLFRILLAAISILLVFAVFGQRISESLITIAKVKENNSALPGDVFFYTNLFIWLRYIVTVIPSLFSIYIIQDGDRLIQLLKMNRYSVEVENTMMKIAMLCRNMIMTTILSHIFFNVLQMIFQNKLMVMQYGLNIPLTSVALAIGVIMLSRYFTESRKIKEDNESFI